MRDRAHSIDDISQIGLQPGSQIRVVVVPADYDIAITVRDAMGHEERIEILARATFRDLQGIYGDLITPRTVKDLIFCSADLPKIDLEGSAEMSLEAVSRLPISHCFYDS